MADSDKDLFAPPTAEEREKVKANLFAPPTAEERAKIANYMNTEQPSMAESALGGAEQGLTLSHAPQIAGLTGAALEGGANALGIGTGSNQSLSDLYNEYQTAKQKDLAKVEKANPASFALGTLGGGALGLMGGGMAGKALGMTAPTAATQAPTMAARMRQGAGIGAGLGAISAQGQSNAPMLSGQMLGDIYNGATTGAETGALATPAVAGTLAAGSKLAGGAKQAFNASWLGQTPEAFKRGFGPNGQASQQFLIGPQAARGVSEGISNISTEIPQTIEDTLEGAAKSKQGIIDAAAEKGIRIDPAKINEFVQTYAGQEPNHIDPAVNSELDRLQTMIKNAQSGREVQRITRKFFAEGNTERGEFAQLFQQKQAEEAAKLAPDAPAPTTEKEAFEDLFRQKQAEQQALPGANDASPYEIHYEPIEGNPKQVLGVIRQRVIQENPDAYTGFQPPSEEAGEAMGTGEPSDEAAQGQQTMTPDMSQPVYRKIASRVINPDAPAQDLPKLQMEFQPLPDQPGKSLGIIKQAVLDEDGNVTGYKIIAKKPLSDTEAAQWRDMSETVRQNDKDLTDPRQLLGLYQTLKNRTQYGEKSFQTPEAQQQATAAVQDIKTMLRGSDTEPGAVEGLRGVDSDIHNLNRAKEAVQLNDNLSDPNRNKLIANLVEKSTGTDVAAVEAQKQLDKMVDALQQVDPEYANQIDTQIKNMQGQMKITGAVQEKAYYGRFLATPRQLLNKGANALGYTIGAITPDTMRGMAQVLARSANSQTASDLANVLLQASSKDERTRNALMFGLMQNAGYRSMLQPLMDNGDQRSSQAKDKSLEKFK